MAQKEMELEGKTVYDAGNESISAGADAGIVGMKSFAPGLEANIVAVPTRAALAKVAAVGINIWRHGDR